jgi:hypothetical protein
VSNWEASANSDPERPADGKYQDISYVPWYCKMTFEQRIAYLDWIIAKREEEDRIWRVEYANSCGSFLAQFSFGDTTKRLRDLREQRRLEVLDHEPLRTTRLRFINREAIEEPLTREVYRFHMDSKRWKRTRRRKLISVCGKCEHLGCSQHAEDCHHLHYETVGFENNADLEALCRPHHRARHGLI